MDKYKIGIVVHKLHGGGGIQAVVRALARAFCRDGHEVHLLMLDEDADHFENAEIHSIVHPSFRRQVKLFRKTLQMLVAERDFDVVLLESYVAYKLASRVDYPKFVYCIHRDYSVPYPEEGWFKRFKDRRKYFKLFNNKNIIAVSGGIADNLSSKLGVNAHTQIIYNPFNFEKICRLSSMDIPAAMQYRPYMLYVGRVSKIKRIDLLIKALPLLKEKINLVIIGHGKLIPELTQLARSYELDDYVHFMGWQENPYAWMKQARLVVLTSDTEGLGNVLVESLVVGTPVVSTDCPTGPGEILTGNLRAYLTPVGDYAALARTIQKALDYYPEIDESNLQRFEENHIIEQYYSLITEMRESTASTT